MQGTSKVTPRVGLRERKKLQTRQTLLAVAERLFEERGYEHVTVAEIADAANISVKTLFTYFRSKEDLAFADEQALLDRLIDALHNRERGVPIVDVIAHALLRLIADEGVDGLEGYHRAAGDSVTLQSHLLRMWDSYEDALAKEIEKELIGAASAARARLVAGLLVALVRSLASTEVRVMLMAHRTIAGRREAMDEWVRSSAELIGSGLNRLV